MDLGSFSFFRTIYLNEALAEELAARLDAGMLTPTEDDSPELKALLATYSRLQEEVPEPDPSLYKEVKHAILQEREPEAQRDPGTRPRERKPSIWHTRRWLAPAFYALTVLLVAFGFAALRWIDTMSELAFLLMDLDEKGHPVLQVITFHIIIVLIHIIIDIIESHLGFYHPEFSKMPGSV